MSEEKDEAAGGPTRAAAQRGRRADEVAAAELPDEGIAASPARTGLPRSRPSLPRPRTGCCARWPRPRTCAAGCSASATMRGNTRVERLSRRICCRRSTICAGRSTRCPRPRSSDPRAQSLRDGVAATERELLGRVRTARAEAHRPEGRALRPQFPPGDLRGGAPRRAGRHDRRGLAAGLRAARPAAAPGDGRRREGRRQSLIGSDRSDPSLEQDSTGQMIPSDPDLVAAVAGGHRQRMLPRTGQVPHFAPHASAVRLLRPHCAAAPKSNLLMAIKTPMPRAGAKAV